MSTYNNSIFWNTENELILMGSMLINESTQPIDDEMLSTLIEVRRRLNLLINKFNVSNL